MRRWTSARLFIQRKGLQPFRWDTCVKKYRLRGISCKFGNWIAEFDENLKLKVCPQETINKLDEDILKVIIRAKTYILSLNKN